MKYYCVFESRLCPIVLAGDDQGLNHLHLDTGEGKRPFHISEDWVEDESFFEKEIIQLNEYFNGERQTFDLRINPQGTDFQKKVWKALEAIPYGETRSYQDIAMQLGNPKSSRAVGMANSRNPIPLIIPCHRVIGKSGMLTGFAHGLNIKEKLLKMEKTMGLYQQLESLYGSQGWWPADTPFEMMMGAVLTQNTTWTNVENALKNFDGHPTPKSIRNMDQKVLAETIKSSGYYNQKAIKLKSLAEWMEQYDDDMDRIKSKERRILRGELLAIKGIGPETADCILTYALDHPSFVVDAYTRRLFERVGINCPNDYDSAKKMIEESIPLNLTIYNEYHALIVKHSKTCCLVKPRCQACRLKGCSTRKCPFGIADQHKQVEKKSDC